jgi:hypothetical protein
MPTRKEFLRSCLALALAGFNLPRLFAGRGPGRAALTQEAQKGTEGKKKMIAKCAREKKLATCAACPEYSCGKLDAFLAQVPEARKTLEALRKVTK